MSMLRIALRTFAVILTSSVLFPAAVPAAGFPQADDISQMMEPLREEKSFKLRAGQTILVNNPYGSVFLRFGGYEHQLDVQATVQQPERAPKITLSPRLQDGRLIIAPSLSEGAALAEDQRMDLVIYVPQKHAIVVTTDEGDIESRGVKSDLDLRSVYGNIAVRGTEGLLRLETVEGSIEAAIENHAPAASHQRFSTKTGSVVVGITDHLDAEVTMATSGLISTDFSIDVTHLDGQEPNKTARAVIGQSAATNDRATVAIESRVGTIRLLRRAVFVEVKEDLSTESSRAQ